MIGLRDQTALVQRVVDGLAHPTHPASWNIVLPTGFADELALADEIEDALMERLPEAKVATIPADSVRSREDYFEALRDAWFGSNPPSSVRPGARYALLDALLGSLVREAPGFQILPRFHKILDALGDVTILAALRKAEQGGRLRSVTLCSYPYNELRERWKAQGHFFCVSDYGDTHHLCHVSPLEPDQIQTTLASQAVPPAVCAFMFDLTGGYPRPFNQLLREWVLRGRPERLNRETCAALRLQAGDPLRRMARDLDPPRSTRFRDWVIDLHHGLQPELALDALSQHPWASLLLREGALRASELGSRALELYSAEISQGGSEPIGTHDLWQRGLALYRRRHFDAVTQLLEPLKARALRQHLRLLYHHAAVMHLLQGGGDADWGALRAALRSASTELTKLSLAEPDREPITARYQSLLDLAETVLAAQRSGDRRIVDTLAGLKGRPNSAPPVAVLLTLLSLDSGRSIVGHFAACQRVLPLPEQIFRLWAFLGLGLDYYRAPAAEEQTWELAQREWCQFGSKTRAPMRQPEIQKEFISFESFTYFALAYFYNHRSQCVTAPEQDFDTMRQALSTLDLRNAGAHAIALFSKTSREKYFSLCDRWMDALISVCPSPLTRGRLHSLVEPLPLIGEDGLLLA